MRYSKISAFGTEMIDELPEEVRLHGRPLFFGDYVYKGVHYSPEFNEERDVTLKRVEENYGKLNRPG